MPDTRNTCSTCGAFWPIGPLIFNGERLCPVCHEPIAGEMIRLCVQTHHPIDTGNYPGPVHCTACPEGTPCVTAMYQRVQGTTFTADERGNR